VLVAGHAPFCWGRTPAGAAHIAVVLEEVASMALDTLQINPRAGALERPLHAKHFYRKHGTTAYYGQKK
jgi:L-ribulose-5-phosphate 4-epimerase